MGLPPLSELIRRVPKSLVTAPPDLWLEDCLAGGVDYVVLVDDQETPVQVLPLHYLLNRVAPWHSKWPSLSEDQDADQTVGLGAPLGGEPGSGNYASIEMAMMAVEGSPESAAEMVSAAPETCWLLVDAQQRYLGMLDKTRLLALALAQRSNDNTPAESELARQQTSRNNTALLTYLGHELKTPLTSLLGLSSLLKTGRLGDLNARQSRYVSLIQQHCRRLAAWVNTLIDLGRIDSGALKLIPNLVDLSTVWREAHRQAALRIGQEDRQTSVSSPFTADTAAISLIADPSRLRQMLTCLMQTTLATRTFVDADTQASPLKLDLWGNWIAFIAHGLDDGLCLDQLSQAASSLPFPTSPTTTPPISGEIGHWLEWLLVRKLAQLHGGELVLVAHPDDGVCPTLLLPSTPAPQLKRDSRFLLLVAQAHADPIRTLQVQATELNYRLLLTHQTRDAIEIAGHIPLSAVLVLIEGPASISDLRFLKAQLEDTDSLVVALVPPQWSAFLGELPADRELLWPVSSLGSVLLQPPSTTPPPNRLTILYLKTPDIEGSARSVGALNLPDVFHDCGCRVLEVDDLEQAGLLRRVWNPDVAVLDPAIADPTHYLQLLSRSPEVASLPLLTLTMAATQAAHAIPKLAVFPCLVSETAWETPEASDRMTAWLIQVLQVAATHHAA